MLNLARELGVALANSNEFLRMKQAQKSLADDVAVNALMAELQQKRQQVVDTLAEADADGAFALELTNDIERLQGQLIENPLFNEWVEAEAAFSALLTSVDAEINACIGNVRSGCNGDCGGCSGCQH